jgi:hypothetical protein
MLAAKVATTVAATKMPFISLSFVMLTPEQRLNRYPVSSLGRNDSPICHATLRVWSGHFGTGTHATAFARATKEVMMSDDKLNRGRPDRSKINMHEDYEVKYWTKHLGVTRDELEKVVQKVGNAARAVEKELGF